MPSETLERISHPEDARKILEDLFAPNTAVFWSDLLISAGVGWGAFALACLAASHTLLMLGGMAVAVLSLYRALAFVHELSHLKRNELPGLQSAWDLLVGMPLLLPSFAYVGIHADHHRLSTYGTKEDPEYLPLAGARLGILGLVAQSLLIPLLFLLRFLVLSPIGLLVPSFHRLLEKHASSLVMNPAYCRRVSGSERSSMMRLEFGILGVWSLPILLAIQGLLHERVFAIWYGVVATITLINSLRALGAHRYRSEGQSSDRTEQLLDSVDTPGNLWTELWAPVGLRYHALHHCFPSLPYHNLGTAYRRLQQALPTDSPYFASKSPSLWHSLNTLWSDRPSLSSSESAPCGNNS